MPELEDSSLRSLLTDVETMVTLYRSTKLGIARIISDAEKTLKSIRDRLLGHTYLYPDSIRQQVKRMTTFWGWIRAGVVRELGDTGSIHVLPYLLIALFWGGRRARESAVDGMANIGGQKVVLALICALDDKNETIRNKAGQYLIQIGSEAVPQLIKELEITWNSIVKQSIIGILDQLDDDRAIFALINCLRDHNPDTLEMAVESVLRFGQRAVKPLTTMLLDNNQVQRIKIFDTLAQLWQHVPLKTVKRCLKDPEPGVRAGAAKLLPLYNDEKIVDTLIDMLNDRYNTVQAAAANALGECRNPLAVNKLLRTLNDSNQMVRLEAARALGKINSTDAVEPLVEKIAGGHFHAFAETVLALALLGDVRALPPLDSLVTNPNSSTQELHQAMERLEYIASRIPQTSYCQKCFRQVRSFMVESSKNPDKPWWESRLSYYACRKCHSNIYLYPHIKRVVWVLDKKMSAMTEIDAHVLKVNALKNEELIDFDEIHIVDADDYQVERLLTRLKNDTDDYRLKRLKRIPVMLSPDLSISKSKINLLRDHFEVRSN